jgi:hypothetical protein
MTSKKVYLIASQILNRAGMSVPIQERDVFSINEKCVGFDDYGLYFSWAKCLTYDSKGRVNEAQRINIFSTGCFCEEADIEDVLDEPECVFDAIITNKGTIETFNFSPYCWVDRMVEITQALNEGIEIEEEFD